MADITAAMVKDLREKTGAGMMDCKAGLTETSGDVEAAVDWLRTKGLAKAAKRAGRIAAEGLVAVGVSDTVGAVVEVNSETDFVARNDTFQAMVLDIANLAVRVDGDYALLLGVEYPGASKSVQEHVSEMGGTIGENMSVRRSAAISIEQGAIASYIHGQVVSGQGKIGVIVALESAGDVEKLEALGRQIAMHIAATNPLAATVEELAPAQVEREREILVNEARESGKSEEIIEKMVDGRIRKFFEEVVLLQQIFVIDGENTVEKVLKNAESDVGASIRLKGFIRFGLGEGIDKGAGEDFAAEVAAVASSV